MFDWRNNMRNLNKKFVVYFLLGAVLLSSMLTVSITASRQPYKVQKNVTSVMIEKGDSLWTIAQTYYSEENRSMKAYIEEIKKCNHLSGNEIKEGHNLIIPYYEKVK